MKTKLLIVCTLAAMVSTGDAQTPTTATAQPAPAPSASAATSAALAPNQTIYAPRLPSATELANAAAAQGLAIERIEQTAAQVTVIYQNPAGQTTTVAYQLLPAAASAPVVATPAPAPVVVTPAPRVVYYEPVYRYYPAYTYDPWYWYPPVSFRLGLSYGFRGGHFHSGFHHRR